MELMIITILIIIISLNLYCKLIRIENLIKNIEFEQFGESTKKPFYKNSILRFRVTKRRGR